MFAATTRTLLRHRSLSTIAPEIQALHPDMTAWRHDFHMHPETCFEEFRTSAKIAEHLTSWGVDVTTKVGRTGVVGTIRGTKETVPKSGVAGIGLRADMDALPMQEMNEFEHKSTVDGKFHGCGHDGHTTMLLGAAKYLSENRGLFAGDVHCIFQPAEEGQAGALEMIKDGLFDRFPCDEVYSMHNWPMLPVGHMFVTPGPLMASADEFEITIKGKGGHAAIPHQSVDPLMIGCKVVDAIQSVISRQTNPLHSAVVSVTKFHCGSANNVIAEDAHLSGTFRTFDPETRAAIPKQIDRIVQNTAAAFGATGEFEVSWGYPTTINSVEQSKYALEVAKQTVGPECVTTDEEVSMGAEDFSYMLQEKPGCYIWIGGGYGGCMVHNPKYDFDDTILPVGAQYFANVVQHRLG